MPTLFVTSYGIVLDGSTEMSIKNEILQAIAKTDDQNMKIVLLLMVGLLEEISDKLDNELRTTVLNGHSDVHDVHHDWVSKKIREEDETAENKNKALFDLAGKVVFGIIVFIAGAVFQYIKQ